MKLRTRIFTYANIVASVALLLSVTGTTYALVVTGASVKNESLTGKDVKNGTLRSVDLAPNSATREAIATGAVGSSELADGEIGAADVADGSLSAAKLASGVVPTVMFARVSSAGVLEDSSAGVTAVRSGAGNYLITLPGDVVDCAAVGTDDTVSSIQTVNVLIDDEGGFGGFCGGIGMGGRKCAECRDSRIEFGHGRRH